MAVFYNLCNFEFQFVQIRALRKMLRWARKCGLANSVPEFEMIPVKIVSEEPLSEAEMAALIRACPSRLRMLVGFILETGCRSGEARNLTWDCIDPQTGMVEFRSREDWRPKTDQSERKVYLSVELMTALGKFPREGRYVFSGRVPGKPIGSFRKALAAASLKAGITRNGQPYAAKPHMLRKSRATQLALDPQVAMPTVQKQLGHAPGSSVTAKVYVRVPDAELRSLAKPLAGLDWASLAVQKGKKGQRKNAKPGFSGRDIAEEAVK